MKKLIYSMLSLVLLFSCRKEASQLTQENPLIAKSKAYLKDNLSPTDFQQLDFSKAITSNYDSGVSTVRVVFKGKRFSENFVALKLQNGVIEAGKIIELSQSSVANRAIIPTKQSFNGHITIQSLNRKANFQSAIKDGFVTVWHTKSVTEQQKAAVVPDPYQTLPEVVVVGYIPSGGGGVSWSTWMSILSLFDGGSGGGYWGSNYYDSLDPFSGGSGGGGGGGGGGIGGGSGGGGIVVSEPIEFETEYTDGLPGVSLTKMFKCFDNVPSAGATYKIKLCSDVPSNSNPGASANFSSASGGHTFLTLTKTNGTSNITQSFGFYPQQTPSIWNPFGAIESEIKDNGVQEINASIDMSISESQFATIKQNSVNWSSRNYELADYNCSDYAVNIFNSVRSTPLIIPGYQIILPGNTNPWAPTDPITITINKSPQMLFRKLEEMKNANGSEAANIRIDQSHNYRAPVSKGECN